MMLFKNTRRNWWRDRVISNGIKLESVQRQRADVDGQQWPEDAEYLDREINRLSRKRDHLLTKLKETA